MDYQRETDSSLGATPDEPEAANATGAAETEATTTAHDAAATPADESHTETTPEAAGGDADTGFGTDADIFNDAFNSGPRPPEWPEADFVAADSDSSDTASAADAAVDPGDDSDAPIVSDAAPAVPVMDTHLRGENVNFSQGGVQSIEASTVTLSQGGAGRVRADAMSVEQGGVGLARVKTLKLGEGASAFAVLADEATVEEGSNTFLVVSRSLKGDVRPTIDWRGALAFGAGLGLALSIIRRIR